MSRDNQASPKKIQEAMRMLYHSGYTLSGLLSVKKCSPCIQGVCYYGKNGMNIEVITGLYLPQNLQNQLCSA